MTPAELWYFLPIGYLASVLIELPVLLVGLSTAHSWRTRFTAAFWLTACTYPIVVLVLPLSLPATLPRWGFLLVAETFAPLAECLLFWCTWHDEIPDRRSWWRDMAAIVAANLASFSLGELLWTAIR